jgi:hypothetical protein
MVVFFIFIAHEGGISIDQLSTRRPELPTGAGGKRLDIVYSEK